MATILKIKRSSNNPTATPSALGQGELAYGEGTSTYTDAQSASVTSFGKLFVGRGTETNGEAASIDIIGGKYFTDLLDHGHGTITANSAAIVDSAKKVDEWNVDNITLNGNTISTTNSNGDLIVDTNGTGNIIFSGGATHDDNLFKINDGSTDRFVVDTFSGALDITTPSLSTADTILNIGTTWNNAGGTFYGIDVDVTNSNSGPASRLLNLSVGSVDKFNVDLSGNVYLTGNIEFASATSFEIQDDTTDAFTIKEGANKYVDIDTNNGSELITFGTGNVDIDNDLNIDGGDLTTNQTTFNLLETNATTVNAFGTATTIDVGATTGTFTLNNPTLVGTQTTQNVFNTAATTVNAFGAATNLNIGDAGSTTTLRSSTLVGTETTQNVFNATATTVNAFGAANTINIGGAATDVVNIGDDSTEVDFGDLRILGSTIYSDNANAQTITIDPFPAGGDSGGNVVVRGNLQVAGTTTTVNSTQMTINDPVFTLGDSISEKTVTAAANSGQANVVLDSVDGLNTGDVVSGNAAVPGGTTISSINTGSKTVTLSANLTSGLAASVNEAIVALTFTQGADDNQDRGIEFKYFNGGLKQGFFGYDESGTSEGGSTTYYFTYIPDATNTQQVFSGTVGKAYFDTVKLEIGNLNGVPFFDQYKRLTTTATPGSADITTSDKILTTNGATGVPVWTTTLDGGTY
tara:strand:+ start:4675 stop:6750 length:2076 start_codon:yes stop_codon:yes gene_type:complete